VDKPRPISKKPTQIETYQQSSVVYAETQESPKMMKINIPYLLRLLCFVSCVGLSVWVFLEPIQAAEVITTIVVDDEKTKIVQLQTILFNMNNSSSLDQLRPLLLQLSNLSLTTPDYIETVIKAFVKVFSTLILIASGGIMIDRGLFAQCLIIGCFITAGVFFVLTVYNNNDNNIFEEWFEITFPIVAVGIPILVLLGELFIRFRKK
jgi:hypothetical protein